MGRDEVLAICAGLPGAIEDYPFGEDVAVFKISAKMFALVLLAREPGLVTLKCDPDWALQLRAQYSSVEPGYHTNKRHWNSVTLDNTVDHSDLHDMIRHSYELVLADLLAHNETGFSTPDKPQTRPCEQSNTILLVPVAVGRCPAYGLRMLRMRVNQAVRSADVQGVGTAERSASNVAVGEC